MALIIKDKLSMCYQLQWLWQDSVEEQNTQSHCKYIDSPVSEYWNRQRKITEHYNHNANTSWDFAEAKTLVDP